MNKRLVKYLLIFISFFIFSFIFFYILGYCYCDEIWVYGFSYNISKGMMIYRDFNVLQTPLYFFITSIFIKLIGNYMIVMHIFDSLLFATMMFMFYNIIGRKSLIMLPVFIFFWPSGYNMLSLFFLSLIIYLVNKKKDNDLLLGFIVGLCFITKQNIGVLLLIPCLFYSRNKIKTLICFFVPFGILSIYLIFNDAFFEFIDYCFLGMFDFGRDNKYFAIIFTILSVINILFLFILVVRTKFKNKELLYILFFQLIVYPIFDARHYVCATFPVIYLILKYLKNKRLLFIFSFCIIYLYGYLLFYNEYDINFENDMVFLRNCGDLNVLASAVKEYVGDNENFFFTDCYNYYIKNYYNISISQYDLLLSGNVGYNGMEKKLKSLDELCSKEKCYFFSAINDNDDIVTSQYFELYDYIVNYEKVDKVFDFYVYTNDVGE